MKESEREEENIIVGMKMKFYYELRHKYTTKLLRSPSYVWKDSRKNGERKMKKKKFVKEISEIFFSLCACLCVAQIKNTWQEHPSTSS